MKLDSLFSWKYAKWYWAVGFFIASFSFRFVSYDQTSYANGWDSYFYLIQVNALLEEGSMHSKDLSLIYPLMIFLQLLLKDYVLMYKITCALLAGLFSLSVYFLSFKWSEEKYVALFLACVTLFSPHLTYFCGQYPKNMLGVILFIFFLMSLNDRRIIISLLLLLLNFFGHRVTAILSVTVGLLYFLVKKRPLLIGFTLLGILLLFLLLGIFLPGILSIADLERFKNVVVLSPQFSPYSFVTTFESISGFWIGEIVLACLLHLTALWMTFQAFLKNKVSPHLASLTIVCLFLLFPFLSWSMESIGYRLFLVYVLLVPLLSIYWKGYLSKPVLMTAGLLLFVLSFFSYKSYRPEAQDPPYALYHKLSERVVEKVDPRNIELIIAHKSLAEYLTFHLGIDAMPWIPEYEIHPDKLWRLVADINEVQLRYYLPAGSAHEKLYFKLSPHYILLKESTWKEAQRRMREEKDEELIHYLDTWKNPSKMRPFYLLKNKK